MMNKTLSSEVVILSIGDVSFDWLWFHVSIQETEGEKRKYAWETQNHMEAVAVHGGAWFAESILNLIFNKYSVNSNTNTNTNTNKYNNPLIYGYQRLPVYYLRAGNSNQFVHSVTHFDLLKYKKTPNEYRKSLDFPDKVYRIKISPKYFGPVRDKNKAIFPRLVPCEANKYEKLKNKYDEDYKNLILNRPNLKQCNYRGEDYSDIFKKPLPYPDRPYQIIQILDEGNGFSENEESWKNILSYDDNSTLKLIILNLKVLMTFERFTNRKDNQKSNSYWECIKDHPTIVIISANELRKHGVKINRGLSWELTAQDLREQLKNHKILKALLENRQLIVRFGISGAIHCNGTNNEKPSYLFYEPGGLEGEYRVPQEHGHMNGFNSIMGGTLVKYLVESLDVSSISKTSSSTEIGQFIEDAIAKSTPQGLANCRHFFCKGFGNSITKLSETLEKIDAYQVTNQKKIDDFFPVEVVAHNDDSYIFCRHAFHDNPDWKIIDSVSNLENTAINIVQYGFNEIFDEKKIRNGSINDKFPFLKFGNLLTVDRKEIESYRGIRNLFKEYHGKDAETPLSIAVFGPPGSGKSFGVKEIAKSLSKTKPLEYNLSQFTSSKDLSRALLKVRDVGINGEIPIVFFDEFDSKFEDTDMGWLKYFLSVMQDGEFKHDEAVLNIGKAILIFAGGTKNTFEEFSNESEIDAKDNQDSYKLAKVPDFKSRLRGFVNISGPDRVDDKDKVFVIRRAIIIRSLLERYYSHLINHGPGLSLNSGVLGAFINVTTYKHGVRSIQAILEMSTLAGARSFDKSHLPSSEQLAIHVDPKEFLARVNKG